MQKKKVIGILISRFIQIYKRIGGIQALYPLVPIPQKFKGFVALTRPLTMLGSLIAGFFLVLLASLYYAISFDLLLALQVGLCLVLLHAAAQSLNQCIKDEILIDKINKPYRVVASGIIRPIEAKVFSGTLFILAWLLAYFINPVFVLGIAVITFFSIFYSMPPLRVKRIFVWSNIWQGIARGLLPVIAVFSIFSTQINLFAIALGVVIAIWISGGQASKDIGDIKGDLKYGIHNFFTVLGIRGARRAMAVFMLTAFIVLNIFISLDILPLNLLALNILILPSIGVLYFIKIEVRVAENNWGWIMFYSTLALFYILPPVMISL